MPNPDPYLRVGLTPSTDVQLYESAALGGVNKTGTAIAQGAASGTQDLTYSETGLAAAQGFAGGTKVVESHRGGSGIALGVASGSKAVTGGSTTYAKTGLAVAEGFGSGSAAVTSAPPPAPSGGASRWSSLPPVRFPVYRDKTGTAVAVLVASGTSTVAPDPTFVAARRRAREDELVLVGAI